MAFVVHTSSPDQTKRFAARLAELADDGDLIVLAGDLGAGKTCFAQGLALGLGIDDRVTSPTFTLHNQYQGRLLLNHLDVYRLDDIGETLDLDLPELLETGVTVIEWGEQVDPVLPNDRLTIRILMGEGDDDRSISLEASGDKWVRRVDELATEDDER